MIELKEGDLAPDFKGNNQNGEELALSDFKGKKLVLYFYPKDDTPGCTKEACNLRDNYEDLQNQGYDVIGVSTDSANSHEKFARKYELPFHLIEDPDKEIVNKYGVYGEKNNYGKKSMGIKRTTFVIDEQGKIEQIFKKVKTEEHAAQIMESSG